MIGMRAQRHDGNGGHDAGFTLVESLVALAIFVAVISALYQGLSVGWRGLRRADAEDRALVIAQNALASAGVETPLVASTQAGVTPDGIAWQADIRAPTSASPAASSAPGFQGFWVTVTVRWKEGPRRPEQALQLQTIKLRRGP